MLCFMQRTIYAPSKLSLLDWPWNMSVIAFFHALVKKKKRKKIIDIHGSMESKLDMGDQNIQYPVFVYLSSLKTSQLMPP